MIVTIVFISIMLFIAGLFNGRMDYIKLHQLDSESWERKWAWEYDPFIKMTIRILHYKHWYYFGLFKPEYKEKFPYSSTILVFITDEWHLRKWLMFLCIELAIVAPLIYAYSLPWWLIPIGVISLKTLRGLGFTLIYDRK